MMLRGEKKKNKEISLNEPIGVDKEGNSISLIDIIECEAKDVLESMEKNEDARRVRSLVESVLTTRERDIIVRRYGLDGKKPETQKSIGRRLNISRSYVSRIEKKALEKMKNEYEIQQKV